MRLARLLVVALGLLWLVPVTPAAAVTCSASASSMAFGSVYTPTNTTYATTATVNITCTGDGTAASIRVCPFVGSGTYGAAAGGPRTLGANTARLDFDVFTTGSYAARYPNDTSDATTPSTTLAVPASGSTGATINLYGRIPSNQGGAATSDYSTVLASGISYGPSADFSDCAGAGGRSQATFGMSISATNSPVCTISTSPVAFGAVAGLGAAQNAVGVIGVTCSAMASYVIALDGGINGGTSATNRKMANGASRVTYGLYRDAARTLGWFNTAGTTMAGTGTGAMQSISVYGRVPIQSTPANGNYSDMVTVTVSY